MQTEENQERERIRNQYKAVKKRLNGKWCSCAEWFFDWAEHATAEESRLYNKATELSELLGDLLFHEGTYTSSAVRDPKSGFFRDNIPTIVRYNMQESPTMFIRYKVIHPGDPEEGMLGCFDRDEQELQISADLLESDATILHELIHVFEYYLESIPLCFRDIIFWMLYQHVRKRIPQLDDLIALVANVSEQNSLNDMGGQHGILFLLKSLDLDMEMGYPLGTVFAYGQSDEFKEFAYH